jgi:phosphatidylserine/phosphatidylglycerophosphate/cardiolipin synthase-like enzyme
MLPSMPTDVYVFVSHQDGRAAPRESRPFGPGPRGGFSTAVWIETDPSTEACAVVSGRVRAAPEARMLLLQPAPAVVEELGAVLARDGALVFVWRGLDPSSVSARLGEGVTHVEAGASLGAPFAPGGVTALGFEILLAPYGLDLGDDVSFARLVELAEEGSTARRLDPATFYAALREPTALAPAHREHPVLNALTRRALVEVRDEWDEPYGGPVAVRVDAASPVCATAPEGTRGTFVIPGPAASVEVMVDGCVLTVLPSDEVSRPFWRGSLSAPSHVALQTLYVSDAPSVEDEPRLWFAPNTPPRRRFTAGNRVSAIRDGLEVFRRYVDTIRTANAPGHRICVAGWFLDDSFPLVPGDPTTTVHALTTEAAKAGVEVRALLWRAMFGQNAKEVAHINELPGQRGAAVLDGDTLDVGSHHQKFLLVEGAHSTVAFAGGIDISPDRLDSTAHGAPGAFHDVQLLVEGPAVGDIRRTFVDRWNHASRPAHGSPLPVDVAPPPEAGSAFVQVACTYPPRKRYPFAPNGALGPLTAFVRAVRKAKRFVYLEDQYITPYAGMGVFEARHDLGLVAALREALARIDALVIVGPNHTDQPQGRIMRAQFWRIVQEAAPEKVHLFYLKRERPFATLPSEVAVCKRGPRSGMSENPDEIYCHSKTWIVDDIVARVGSANCNRRSYTHDSELDVVVLDGAVDNGARAFARRLRVDLWQELLRLPDPSVLEDARRALAFFRDPPPGSLLRRYDPSKELELGVVDRVSVAVDDIANHLRLARERFLERLGAAADSAVKDLEADPGALWSIVDPDGR